MSEVLGTPVANATGVVSIAAFQNAWYVSSGLCRHCEVFLMSDFPSEVQEAIDNIGPGVAHVTHKVGRETVWSVGPEWLANYEVTCTVSVRQGAFGLTIHGYSFVAQALGQMHGVLVRCPNDELLAKDTALRQVFEVLDRARQIPGAQFAY